MYRVFRGIAEEDEEIYAIAAPQKYSVSIRISPCLVRFLQFLLTECSHSAVRCCSVRIFTSLDVEFECKRRRPMVSIRKLSFALLTVAAVILATSALLLARTKADGGNGPGNLSNKDLATIFAQAFDA